MTLPLYILRRFVEPGGVRLKPLEFDNVAGKCATCGKPVLYKIIVGEKQLEGNCFNGEYRHYGCRTQMFYPYEERGLKDKKVPKGNLDDAEYRFWVGEEQESAWAAMCRACRKIIYTHDIRERAQHFNDDKYSVGGDPCSTRLVKAYKKMENLKTCIVCKDGRHGKSKWGVPLCLKPECVRKWKFSREPYHFLEMRLDLDKRKAALLQNNVPHNWCKVCHVFEDMAGHQEMHNAYLMGGYISRGLDPSLGTGLDEKLN